MPMLYRAMPNLYRAELQSPSQSTKWVVGSGGRRAIEHQAGPTKLNDIIVATDCLAKTDTSGWNAPPPTEVCHERSRSRRLVALSFIQPVEKPGYPGRRTT
jgi:hypothetical protein